MSRSQCRNLQAYYDGQLDELESAFMTEHIKECHACQVELQNLSELSDMLKSSEPASVSEFELDRLRENVADSYIREEISVRSVNNSWILIVLFLFSIMGFGVYVFSTLNDKEVQTVSLIQKENKKSDIEKREVSADVSRVSVVGTEIKRININGDVPVTVMRTEKSNWPVLLIGR